MKFTEIEMQRLQVGETFGPFLATAQEVHNAQSTIHGHSKRWPGSKFTNKSVPIVAKGQDGPQKIPGWYYFEATRVSRGHSAKDNTILEPITPLSE